MPTQVDEAKASTGGIGCSPSQNTIEDVDESQGTRSWTAQLVDRVENGKARISHAWHWSREVGLVLALDRASGAAAIRVQYRQLPERKTAPVEIERDAL